MRKIFLDADICFDYLFQRNPFYDDACAILQKGEQYLVCSLTFSHLFYHLRKNVMGGEAIKILENFREIVSLSPVDQVVVDAALQSSFKDYEDALQYYSAREAAAELVITRNVSDYPREELPVVSPKDFLGV